MSILPWRSINQDWNHFKRFNTHIFAPVPFKDHITFEYKFHIHTPKSSNQNAVFIEYNILI